MSALSALRMAWRSIAANRMRSLLTMLGIVIGVGSVILLVAAGNATTSAVEGKLEGLGTNTLVVYPGGYYYFNTGVPGTEPQLSEGDAEAIATAGRRGGIAGAYPVLSPQVVLQNGSRSDTVNEFTGVNPAYLRSAPVALAAGRLLTGLDERDRARVMILGSRVAERLFGKGKGAGQSVVANGVRFSVVGILAPVGAEFDSTAFAPFSAVRDNLSGPWAPPSLIYVEITHRSAAGLAKASIEVALRRSHQLRPGQEDDFSIEGPEGLVGTTNSISALLGIVLAGVAATSLFVGGMGVMNIMLVTVIERTREIGIRKAIGARRSQIVSQFLVESVVLCLLGGLGGVVVGGGLALVVGHFTGYAVSIGILPVVVAIGVSAAVGLFFGFYPANRAAAMPPIDALRHE
ncbi:MAG: ABC transporter permease [Actinobacteria bacterium]|nr:ABC transporter permease [Actinomycetota bacterium]